MRRKWSKKRKVVERPVSPIVDPDTWQKALATLDKNFKNLSGNGRRRHMLRGLMKCGLCGMNSIGHCSHGKQIYYRCSANHHLRGRYGKLGMRCPSKWVPGDMEDVVWADVEALFRDPGPILKELAGQLDGFEDKAADLRKLAARHDKRVVAKARERERGLRCLGYGPPIQ